MKDVKFNLPEGVRIVECKDISLAQKDIIELKKWKDFLYLLGGSLTIFKLKNSYYLLSDVNVYFYKKEAIK